MLERVPLVLACVLGGGSVLAWAAPPEEPTEPLPAGATLRIGTVQFHHANASHIEFSPDGKRLLTMAFDSVRLWDASTGKPIREIKLRGLNFAGFTADGRTIVVWNDNPKGKGIVASGENPIVHVFDTETGKETRQIPLVPSERDRFHNRPEIVAGKGLGTLATQIDHEPVIIYDVATGKEIRRLDSENAKSLRALRFSPDGKLVAGSGDSASRYFYKDVYYVFDVATGKELHRFQVDEKASMDERSLLFSPDGKILSSGLHAGSIYLWDLTTGKELCRIKEFNKDDHLDGAAFSADAKTLCTWERKAGVRLWQIPTGKPLHQFKLEIHQVLFTPNSRILVATGYHATHIIDVTTGKELKKLPKMLLHYARTGCSISADGTALAAVGADDEPIIWVWRVPSFEPDEHFGREHRSVENLALGDDGKSLASWNSLGLFRWHDLGTGKELTRFSLAANQFGIATDGKLLTTRKEGWGLDEPLVLRDPASGKETCRITPKPANPTREFALSPDSRRLAVASWRFDAPAFEIALYETGQGELVRKLETLPLEKGRYWHFKGLAFSPNGQTLAVTGSGSPFGGGAPHQGVYLWDVARGKKQPLIWGKQEANCIVYSPDSKCLLVINHEQPVRLLELASAGERWKLEDANDATQPFVFSPNGKLLASARKTQGLGDAPILLWDAATGQKLRTLPGHQDRVLSLVFNSDGDRLISGSADTTILVWDLGDLPKAKVVPLAKERLDTCWQDLGAEAAKANAAIRALVQAEDQAVTLLEERVRPEKLPDIKQLVADLDADEFQTREKASKELQKLGDAAEPALRNALKGKPSLELQRRAESILEKMEDPPPAEVLRDRRAIEVLEKIATSKARGVLDNLGKATPGTQLGDDAQAALARLKRRLDR